MISGSCCYQLLMDKLLIDRAAFMLIPLVFLSGSSGFSGLVYILLLARLSYTPYLGFHKRIPEHFLSMLTSTSFRRVGIRCWRLSRVFTLPSPFLSFAP